MSLEERLFKFFDDQQKVEHEAREIESLIKSFDGASGLLPERKYGTSVDPSKFGLTLNSIIERNHKELAAYLKISTGYWERKAKEQDAYDQMVQSMQEKTETLRQRNLEDRANIKKIKSILFLFHFLLSECTPPFCNFAIF